MPALARGRKGLRPRQYTTVIRPLHKHPVTAVGIRPEKPPIAARAPVAAAEISICNF
jgi:hypothetical protein